MSGPYRQEAAAGGDAGYRRGEERGDWLCPNPECGNVNFARREQCNKCGAANSSGAGGELASGNGRVGNYRGVSNNLEYGRSSDGAGDGYPYTNPRSVTSDCSVVPETAKQCDEKCGETCDNSRIYISNLPIDVTTDELRDLFGGIGQVARLKQKRGYKDQWPWSIKLYTDEAGNNKGDAVLTYEDPSAAHSAGGFFHGYMMRGHKISVTMSQKPAPKVSGSQAGSYGSGAGAGAGNRGRDGYANRNRDSYGGDKNRNRYGGDKNRHKLGGDKNRDSHGGDENRDRHAGGDKNRDWHGGDGSSNTSRGGSGGPDRRQRVGNRSRPY